MRIPARCIGVFLLLVYAWGDIAFGKTVPRIDILLLYTPEIQQSAWIPLSEIFQRRINEVNEALANSHADVRIELLGTKVIYPFSPLGEERTSAFILQRLLAPNDGFFDEAHNLRDLYGAALSF